MPPSDLRSWIDLLRREGELVEIEAEVDPYLEVTEIVDRTVKSGGPALLFRNPKGSEHPLLINQFGTERRMALAFGVDSLDDVARRVEDVLEMQPPQGLVEKVKGLGKLKQLADSMPKTVGRGACQEVVLEPNLDLLPIQHCWPGDPAPVRDAPRRHHARPAHRHAQRRHVPHAEDRRADDLHALADPQGRRGRLARHGRPARRRRRARLRPDHDVLGERAAPKHIDEFMLAGFLKGSPVELVQAKTVDLEVPANAEIVLEGYIEKGELGTEGPFGDHTGYYSPAEPFPVFHLTAMTMRRDAIYPSIVVGVPPQEDAWLGKATERIFLPAIRMTVPEIVDYDLPVAGAFHNCVIVSIRKAFPGHARKVMHAIWGLGMLSLSKSVVVVDEFVDVHDYEQVFFHVCANVDPKRDVVLADGPLDQLDHAADAFCSVGSSASTRRTSCAAEGPANGPSGSRCPPKFVTWSTGAGPSTESTGRGGRKRPHFQGYCAKSYVFDTTRPPGRIAGARDRPGTGGG